MRAPLMVMVICGLAAACGPKLPESGAGPGFVDYQTYLRTHGSNPYGGAPVAPEAPTGFSTDIAASAIAEAEAGTNGTAPAYGTAAPLDPMSLSGERARGNAPAGIEETTAEMGYVSGGVSDEQDFSAVTSRESIESDKARIEANRAQYVVIQPGALPVRPGDTGPNIAEYAIATTNPVGVSLYSRPRIYLVNIKAACLKFTSSDLAQQAFLANGGPNKDPKGLDPDGDGFACDWDPRPFRAALQ